MYFQHDEKERKNELYYVLKVLNFSSLSIEDLKNIMFYPIILESENAGNLVKVIQMLKSKSQ